MARRNKGERAPSGGGEREKSAERKKVEQEIGKETVNAVDKYYERQGKKAERASDEELAQLEKMLRETTDGRNQQKYSEETIQRALEAKKNGEEDFDINAYEKEQRKLAREAFEKKRKAEMKNILAGRSPEVAAREMTQDMKKLAGEIEEMKTERYLDPEMHEYQKKQLEQAMAQYGSMSMRRERVFEEMSEAQQEAVLYEQDETSPVSGEAEELTGEADVNTAEKMTSAAYDAVIASLGAQDAALREMLEKKKAELESRDQELFEQVDQGVQNLADETEAAVQEEAEAQRSQEYWDNMAAMAAEAEANPGRWMSEEEKAELAEQEQTAEKREGLVQKLHERLKARKGFKRVVARTVAQVGIVLMSTLMLAGFASRSAGGSNGPAANVVYAAEENAGGDEVTGQAEMQAEIQAAQAEAEAVMQELGIGPEDLKNSGDIDYEGVDLLNVGEQMYAGMAEREGTQVLPNGLMGNLTEYETANAGKGTNHFGESKDFVFDLGEVRNATTAQELLSIVRDQPQTMAAFVANYPQIMEAAGIDASVIENQNVEQRAQGVMDALLGENGGDLQKKLLAASGLALYNENTNFEFYLENDTERTFYMAKEDAALGDAIENVKLRLDTKKRNNAKQVQIVMTFADGTQESGDFNLNCGFQPNLKVDTPTKREPIVTVTVIEEVPDDEPDTPPDDETPPDDTPPDDETPPETPKPKDEDNEKKVVEDGGQTNPVDQTENIDNKTPGEIETPSNQTPENQVSQDEITGNTTGTYDQTEESTATSDGGAEQAVVDNQVADETVSSEQQEVDQNNQEAADEAYESTDLTDMTDDEFNEYVNSLL